MGNLYWAQPLIAQIAASLEVSPSSASMLVTVTQIGYAIGIFLVAPLGDVLNRRRLIPTMLALSVVALLGAAAAPDFSVLLAALGGLGLTTVSGPLLAPLASELAAPGRRGRVVGSVASGGLLGVLLGRTISGAVAEAFGWRAIYLFAAVAVVVLAIVLHRLIPDLPPRHPVPYGRLLCSVFVEVRRHPAATPTIVISAAGFAVFSLFWTSLTFLLTAPPFSFSVAQVGLTGLAGLAGALGARRVGAAHDRGWSVHSTGVVLVLIAVSLIAALLFQRSVIGLIVVIVVLDFAAQANLVLSQMRLLALPGSASSRLNTAVVVANFIGGAVGSAAAGAIWAAAGWPGVTVTGVGVILFALIVWISFRHTRLADQT
nr:MFS transporter [Planctomonas deserti]